MQRISQQSRFRAVLIGTAVGDALGLPAEGVSRRRIGRLFPGPWRHRLILGRGMVSDDTEHTVFISQALLAQPESAERFARRFARSLRWWFVSLPAGIGLGTGRAIVRLWLGFPPARSGVRSAGNGAAMRVAPIGARFADKPERRVAYVQAATRVTHSDPRALVGAEAVASMLAGGHYQKSSVPADGAGAWIPAAGTAILTVCRWPRACAQHAARQGIRRRLIPSVP